jgi:AcrR family transcriptional regulator
MDDTRDRIIAAALELLARGGQDAVSTRAVSAAAGVQPPTIYRLFGDKDGLLDAVATQGFVNYLASKSAVAPSGDPVADLRDGWDAHIELALANPTLYQLMYSRSHTDAATSSANSAAAEVLAARIRRVAEAGRLRVPEPLAAALTHAAGFGTALSLIATPPERRDPALADAAREAVIAAITTDAPAGGAPGPSSAAIALLAALPRIDVLTDNERALMGDWLGRIAAQDR